MTKPPQKRDMAVSVRQRLLDQARASGQDFQRLLVRYGIERLLYRLSRTNARNRYVLKGAMLFAAWADAPFRATGDLDLLGFGDDDVDAARTIFADLCRLEPDTDASADGLIFVADSVKVERTREDEDYRGLHVRLEACLKSTRIPILIDIGFGDPVHPAPLDLDYPRLIPDLPPAHIRAYPAESVIAEKFDAMVRFDADTTRLKDHYDIWAITETFPFDAGTLLEAVRRTLNARARPIPVNWPAGLTPEFGKRPDKLAQWRAFLNRAAPTLEPPSFPELIDRLRLFLGPVMHELSAAEGGGQLHWFPGRGWNQL
ncbi:nucleotidyl transferase AbiEii/AbiGii toxin family protein [Sphingopyxis flava]|uniref:Nucleotidyl transferase AbiEii toxin, Type IV TA system n=1 Tax=Sphingopyxis flava TaxID=1507287 RepID=A0A1T5F4Q0_9SPHN|nr:nucleotidyl transferase AbiEii/AbiGii toxin family protein [Sphingopyxis flava]SKB91109.1 Nucleotidyl transferase AbiEii toxin, Type IV TA system [Sphingopyxis flava]